VSRDPVRRHTGYAAINAICSPCAGALGALQCLGPMGLGLEPQPFFLLGNHSSAVPFAGLRGAVWGRPGYVMMWMETGGAASRWAIRGKPMYGSRVALREWGGISPAYAIFFFFFYGGLMVTPIPGVRVGPPRGVHDWFFNTGSATTDGPRNVDELPGGLFSRGIRRSPDVQLRRSSRPVIVPP